MRIGAHSNTYSTHIDEIVRFLKMFGNFLNFFLVWEEEEEKTQNSRRLWDRSRDARFQDVNYWVSQMIQVQVHVELTD